MCFFCFFKTECKLRSDSLGADDIDVFIMCIDDFFYDGKTKSCSFLILAARVVCFVETIPDLCLVFRRNTDAVIFDRNKYLIIFIGDIYFDICIGRTEFDCIVDQVVNNLLDTHFICTDHVILILVGKLDFNAFRIALSLKRCHRILDDRHNIKIR